MTKAASLLSATLSLLEKYAIEKILVPLRLVRSWSPFTSRLKRLKDNLVMQVIRVGEGVRQWLAERGLHLWFLFLLGTRSLGVSES